MSFHKSTEIWTPSKILLQFILVCILIYIAGAQPQGCELYRSAFPACKCLKAEDSNVGVIDCSGLGLKSVPAASVPVSGTIYEMRLNNNDIVRLTNNSFAGLKIKKLDLSGNRISTVEDGAFQGLAQTTITLYIDGDGASSPPIGALSKLVNLRELTMRNYGTSRLSEKSPMFIAFSNLQKLTLENWKLVSISSNALIGIYNLISLTLNKQPLLSLPVSLLNSGIINSLRQLTISNTYIEEITDYAFQSLTNLQKLDLSHNHISKLDSFSFDGLANSLEILNLSGNVLKSGTLQGLKNLPNLVQLDLSSNKFITSAPNLLQLNTEAPLNLLFT